MTHGQTRLFNSDFQPDSGGGSATHARNGATCETVSRESNRLLRAACLGGSPWAHSQARVLPLPAGRGPLLAS